MTYYDQLKHPRWQRKRLEVMQRANFLCEHCGADDVTLNIHHSYYEKGRLLWDYPDDSLHCLCENCHTLAQDRHAVLQRQLGQLNISSDIEELIGFACGLQASHDPDALIDVFSYSVAQGLGWRFCLNADEVIAALEDGRITGQKLEELYCAWEVARAHDQQYAEAYRRMRPAIPLGGEASDA